MTTYGPWMDDSLPVWVETGTANTNGGSTQTSQYFSEAISDVPITSYETVLQAAWDGTGASYSGGRGGVYGPGPAFGSNAPFLNLQFNGIADWVQMWVTATRTDSGHADTGVLPPGTDPDAIGVEWEPSSTPVDQKLVISLGVPGYDPETVDGETIHVKLGQANPSGVYAPPFEAASALAARSTLATFAAPTTQVEIGSLPIALTGPASLAVTLLDNFAQTHTIPAYSSLGDIRRYFSFTMSLQAAFTPRYRLIYADPATSGRIPPIRHVQRGDGLGLSTAPRMSQVSSIQGSLRNSSYL